VCILYEWALPGIDELKNAVCTSRYFEIVWVKEGGPTFDLRF